MVAPVRSQRHKNFATLHHPSTSLYPLPSLGTHHMRSTSDTVAAIGLAIGGALGMAGTFVGSDAPAREAVDHRRRGRRRRCRAAHHEIPAARQ